MSDTEYNYEAEPQSQAPMGEGGGEGEGEETTFPPGADPQTIFLNYVMPTAVPMLIEAFMKRREEDELAPQYSFNSYEPEGIITPPPGKGWKVHRSCIGEGKLDILWIRPGKYAETKITPIK